MTVPYSARCAAALAAALLLSLGAASSALATPATLKRSVSNMVGCPVDFATAPVVAGRTVYRNLREIDDSRAVRIFYPIPGYLWTTSVQIGAAVLRGVAGVLELVPGIILLPFDTDTAPLFDPSEDNAALLDWDTPVLRFKWGVDYTSPPL